MQNTESPLMNNGEAKNDAKVVVNTAVHVVESEPAKSDADKRNQFTVINPEIAAHYYYYQIYKICPRHNTPICGL